MWPVVRRCVGLLDGATSLVRFEAYSGGHDVAWWREGLLRALDEWCVRGDGAQDDKATPIAPRLGLPMHLM